MMPILASGGFVLASKSQSRQAMLQAAGLKFTALAADIDERKIESESALSAPHEIALHLAKAKACAVSSDVPNLVLGSDSIAICNGQRFDKPVTRNDAAAHLRAFSGKTLELYSAAAFARAGTIIWQDYAKAELKLRHLSDAFIAAYLDTEWPDVSYCVGVFRIEALGVQLFTDIKGDQFTVLGMPLLKVLEALREFGGLGH